MASLASPPANEYSASGPLAPPPRSASREPSLTGSDRIRNQESSRNNKDAIRQGSADRTGDMASDYPDKADGSSKRRRDHSRSSKRSAHARENNKDTAQSSGVDTAQPKPKKKAGFLSFLNCCGGPADVDDDDTPISQANTKLGTSRTQSARNRQSHPEEYPLQDQQHNASATNTSADSKDLYDEKNGSNFDNDGKSNAVTSKNIAADSSRKDGDITSSKASDQSHLNTTGAPLLNTFSPTPALNVQSATPVTAAQAQDEDQIIADRTPQQAQRDTDIEMTDAGPSIPLSAAEVPQEQAEEHEIQPRKSSESASRVDLPPPPPLAERQAQTHTAVVAAHQTQTNDQSVTWSQDPSRKWLLPPLKPDMQGRKCLVLDLDETLVHSSFKILHQADFTIPVEIEGSYHNVYVIKRPGVDAFLKRVGEIYEVVVFTASVAKYGDPLLDQLDISGSIHHRLFRESCYNHQGNYVKDLSQVGRKLEETIIIDNSPTSYIFHPQHAVPISSWFSDAHDNELLDLIPVLEDLAGADVRDVSLVLDVAL